MSGDFADYGAGKEAEFFFGDEENGFDFGVEFAVGESDSEFIFVVGDGAESTEDDAGVFLLGEVHKESGEGFDLDVGEVGGRVGEGLESLVEGEVRGFVGVDSDGDDEFVVHFGGSFDDIEVADGGGIERSGVDGPAGHGGDSTSAIRLKAVVEKSWTYRCGRI